MGLLIIIQMGIMSNANYRNKSYTSYPPPCDDKIWKGAESLIFFEEFYQIFKYQTKKSRPVITLELMNLLVFILIFT